MITMLIMMMIKMMMTKLMIIWGVFWRKGPCGAIHRRWSETDLWKNLQKQPLLSYAWGRNMILQWDTNTSARFYTNTMIHDKQISGYPHPQNLPYFSESSSWDLSLCLCVVVLGEEIWFYNQTQIQVHDFIQIQWYNDKQISSSSKSSVFCRTLLLGFVFVSVVLGEEGELL